MRQERLLKSIVGEEIFESLSKALQKLSTNSVVDIGELYHSLRIAPKAVVAFLIRELKDMKGAKEIKLPWSDGATMLINKLANDVYKGHIAQGGFVRHEFNLSSLPALAAHLTSHFELYDAEDAKQQGEAPSDDKDRLRELEAKLTQVQIQMLESKINNLMSMVASRQSSEEVQKTESLEKVGSMPKMPSPPKPGSNVGGNQGRAKTGILGNKTQATDRMSKPVKALDKPQINTVKLKTITFNKSDMMNQCMECKKSEFDKDGAYTGCLCWRSMSKPKIKKNEADKVTLEFGADWDDDALVALIRSVKKYGRDTN